MVCLLAKLTQLAGPRTLYTVEPLPESRSRRRLAAQTKSLDAAKVYSRLLPRETGTHIDYLD